MNDEWNSSDWLSTAGILRPEMTVGLRNAKIESADGSLSVDPDSSNLAIKAVEAAFHKRMEQKAAASALKAQMEREMEVRRCELKGAAFYDNNPDFGAF